MNPNPATKPCVVLVGNGFTALTALRSLIARCQVAAVVRDLESATEDSVRALAADNGIPVLAIQRMNELAELISRLKPEAVIVSSFNRIIPAEVLALSRFVNVHYSPLPQYRGRANVNWALINGEPKAAISIHQIAPGLDSGNLLHQEEIAIGSTDTAGSLYERLNAIQERVLAAAVLRLLDGDEGSPQDQAKATYGCARIPEDGEIDWRASTIQIDRLIRALASPFPGAFTYLECRPLVVIRATPGASTPIYVGRVTGRVVGRSAAEGWVDVLTGDGVLRLLEVEMARGSSCPPASLIKSTRVTLGLSKAELLRKVCALESRLAVIEGVSQPPVSASPV